jgi:hypothetical protein
MADLDCLWLSVLVLVSHCSLDLVVIDFSPYANKEEGPQEVCFEEAEIQEFQEEIIKKETGGQEINAQEEIPSLGKFRSSKHRGPRRPDERGEFRHGDLGTAWPGSFSRRTIW